MHIRRVLARAFAALALAATVAGATPGAGLPGTTAEAVRALQQTVTDWTDGDQQWVESWAAASQAAMPLPVRDATIRTVLRQRADGTKLRLRLANTFGTRPVTIDRVTVAASGDGAALVAGSRRAVTFDGERAVTLSPGGSQRSDELRLDVHAGEDLTVSLYLAGPTTLTSAHRTALQTGYLSAPGDHSDDESAAEFKPALTTWPVVDAVSVLSGSSPGTIVAFGDSITDGVGSTTGTHRRWPDLLAERLDRPYSIVNVGISGNRVLTDGSGVSALHRFDRDVLSRPGVRYVVLLEGINDLNLDSRPGRAAQIIAGYRTLLSQAHDHGIRVIGGTLTPVKGAWRYSTAMERQRQLINYWVRTSGQFDGVVDFDRATRDPASPLRLRPAYDCGDHLHPSDAGYRAMAAAIDPALFHA